MVESVVSKLGLQAQPRLPLPPPTQAPWLEGEVHLNMCLGLLGGSSWESLAAVLLQDGLDTISAYSQQDFIICTNDWMSKVPQLGDEAKDWLRDNTVYLYVSKENPMILTSSPEPSTARAGVPPASERP